MPVTLGGGGGLIAIVVVLAFLFLGGGGGLGDLGSLTGQTVGPSGQPSGELAQDCQTGQDANEREDCRIVAVINSVQAYWSKTLRGYEADANAVLRRRHPDRLRRRRRLRPGRSTARATATSTSTSASSISCSRSSARAAGRSQRRTSLLTSTGITCRI